MKILKKDVIYFGMFIMNKTVEIGKYFYFLFNYFSLQFYSGPQTTAISLIS